MEAAKNAISHAMGYDKEDSTSTEQHGHHSHLHGHHKKHDDQTASTTDTSDTQNTSPADAPSKPASAGNSGNNDQQGQSTEEGGDRGPDPALVGDPNPKDKLTGTGAPGSHSAYFGLTPDGNKVAETSKGSTAPQPAHSKETAVGGGKQQEGGEDDTGSRAPAGNEEVSEQMQKAEADPDQKGAQRTDPVPLPAGDDKPGAGATGGQQHSGNV